MKGLVVNGGVVVASPFIVIVGVMANITTTILMPAKKAAKKAPAKKAPAKKATKKTRPSLGEAKEAQGANRAWVNSYVELAARIGTTRRTLNRWKEQYSETWPRPRPNGDHSVAAWEKFIKDNALDVKGKANDPEPSAIEGLLTKDELGRMDLKVKIAERAFKLAKDKEQYIHSEVVRETVMGVAAEAIKLLRDRLENELPPILEGQDALFVRVEMEKVVSDFCEAVHSGFGTEDGQDGSEGDSEALLGAGESGDTSEDYDDEEGDEEGETEDFTA